MILHHPGSVQAEIFFSVFGVRCPAMVLQRLLSDFGRPKRARTTTMAEEEAAQRLIETGVHALERDRRFEFAWKHLRSYDEVWGPLLDEARQLHAAGQLFEEVREEQEEVPETVAMLAEPKSKIWTIMRVTSPRNP